ncbi:MAG: hypothetical protein OEZ23_06240 [Gammaproteobacteria bacterium]|nr:hypothetical protein [Gammaproteobacteria bacterium]
MLEFAFKNNLLLITGSGHITFDDLVTHFQRLLTHPLYDPLCNVMMDFRRVDSLDLEAVQLRSIVDAERVAGYKRRIALTTSTDHVYGLARVFQSMATDLSSEYRVFRDYFSGMAWLLGKGSRSGSELKKMRQAGLRPDRD